MDSQKLLSLVTLVSFMVLVSLALSQTQETNEPIVGTKNTEIPREDNQDVPAEQNYVCRTEECKGRAKLINQYLNNNIDACEDFYGYVCGNWINNHTTNGSYDTFQMLHHRYVEALTHMLQSKEPTYSTQVVIDKPFILYNSCMALTTEGEAKAMLEIIESSKFKDWPVTTQTPNKEEIFNTTSDVLSKVGISPMIQYIVSRSAVKPIAHAIKILPLGIVDLPEDDYIKNAVKAAKPNISDTDLKNVTDGLKQLREQWVIGLNATQHQKIAKAAPPNETTIEELGNRFTKIPLYEWLSQDFKNAKVYLAENNTIELYNPVLYETIDQFLETVDPLGLYNYLGLHSMILWLSWRPSRVQDKQPRPEHCTNLVYIAMKEVVTHLYAEKYFPASAKMEVEKMFQKIKQAFAKAINNTKWMDNEAKVSAQRKLTSLVGKIGYPMWVLNITILQELYEHVPALYPNMSFFYMMHIIHENKEIKAVEKLWQPFDKYMEWFYNPSPVNAYFNFWLNEFVYPLGAMQSPFFEVGLPRSLNFGGIGMIIAHEITHAFARASPLYKSGTMMYLKNETKVKQFDETVECFQHQYGNITDNEANITLNGLKTIDENIADNSGLQMTISAYQKMVMDDCGNTTTSLEGLPGMSGMKLLFIGYGMSWCNAISENALKRKIASDTHSPNMYRVNIPLLNLEAFATTFNCSHESPMLKKSMHKCTLW